MSLLLFQITEHTHFERKKEIVGLWINLVYKAKWLLASVCFAHAWSEFIKAICVSQHGTSWHSLYFRKYWVFLKRESEWTALCKFSRPALLLHFTSDLFLPGAAATCAEWLGAEELPLMTGMRTPNSLTRFTEQRWRACCARYCAHT